MKLGSSWLVLLVAVFLFFENLTIAEQPAAQKKLITNYCELAAHPEKYRGKDLYLRALYRAGFEWSELYSIHCMDAPDTWAQIAANAGTQSPKAVMKQFGESKRMTDWFIAGVVVRGRLTETQGSFGHLSAFSRLFVIDRFESAEILDKPRDESVGELMREGLYRRDPLPAVRLRMGKFEQGDR